MAARSRLVMAAVGGCGGGNHGCLQRRKAVTVVGANHGAVALVGCVYRIGCGGSCWSRLVATTGGDGGAGCRRECMLLTLPERVGSSSHEYLERF